MWIFKGTALITGRHLKMVFLEISQNSEESTCARDSFFNTVAGLRHKSLWHRCFPVNFARFVRTPFLQNTSGRLLLSFRWLKLSLNLERSFTEKMEFDFILINCDILPFYILMQQGKNDDWKTLVLQNSSSWRFWLDDLVLWFLSLAKFM